MLFQSFPVEGMIIVILDENPSSGDHSSLYGRCYSYVQSYVLAILLLLTSDRVRYTPLTFPK